MPFRSDASNWRVFFLLFAFAFSLFCLFAGYQARLTGDSARVYELFDIAWENNVAAWWSGALLALAAFLAAEAASRHRESDPALARGWAILAGLLLFLSADEIGSLHERLGLLGGTLGLGAWALILPLGALLGMLYLYAATLLWTRGARRSILLVTLAFTLLASVALQEYVEHAVAWGSRSAEALRLVVEEGTELTGMLILVATLLAAFDPGSERPFGMFERRGGSILLVALFAAAGLLALTLSLDDLAGRGRPIDWLTAVLWLAAAALAARRAVDGVYPLAHAAMALVYVVASAAAVAVDLADPLPLGAWETGERAFVYAVLMAAVLPFWLRLGRFGAGIGALGAALLYAGFPASAFTDFVLPCGLALAVFGFHVEERLVEEHGWPETAAPPH
ncbi:MAG: hypothetical protein QNJ13_10865 [Paracoccaceae bacterium]|nr:hypothetical protein [Paracoccaceae bacterium]